ncbi:MAG: ParB/RepB/Spo0J family partition protein, partial [Firmicutes bacterium]|nr:ParB/RepB/Spo0J family partition protein [Bacillota bacterium]
ERRYRASKMAGLEKIPAIVRTFTDEQMMEIALLENLQRENLSPIEEAKAYQSMVEHLHLTQDELSKKVGKSRSHLTNMLGLLRLPTEVQNLVNDEKLTMGHARALSKLEDKEQILKMAHEITENKLPVRAVEEKLTEDEFEKKVKIRRRENLDKANYKYVEDLLREKLDTKVRIKDKKIEIGFTSPADLNRILEIIQVKE